VVVWVGKYKRRSTDEDHQPFSIEAQDAKLDAYIASQDNWRAHPDCDFTDNKSGYTLERPGLQRALTLARAGRYDVLLVAKIDRLSRSIRGLTQILDDLDTAGVAFRSATEPFDTATPAGRMMVQMLGVFAEFERQMIIDRVIAGMERKAARGAWTVGSIPFGYTADPETGFLVPLPLHAPLVAIMFDLYANQRLGARNIAGWLNQRGHRTRQGRRWSHTSVLTVLRNRAYIGEISFRGRHYKAPHPPLVDRELFERVQALLAERGESLAARAANSSDYLATGKLRCGHCNKRYVGAAAIGNRYRYRYYICHSHQRYGADACPSERLPADDLDRALLEALLTTLQRTDLIERAAANLAAQLDGHRDRYHAQLASVEEELRRTERAIDRYMHAFEEGHLDLERFGPRVEELALTSKKLQKSKESLLTALDEDDIAAPAASALASLQQNVREAIEVEALQAKKALISAHVQEVEIRSRSEIYPTFRVPTAAGMGAKVRTLSSQEHSCRPCTFDKLGKRLLAPRPATRQLTNLLTLAHRQQSATG
jgi:site-specific DNA recombinase